MFEMAQKMEMRYHLNFSDYFEFPKIDFFRRKKLKTGEWQEFTMAFKDGFENSNLPPDRFFTDQEKKSMALWAINQLTTNEGFRSNSISIRSGEKLSLIFSRSKNSEISKMTFSICFIII